jgi:RHS repeat-associated protein
MARLFTFLQWMFCVAGLLLALRPTNSQAQTVLQAGDIIITGVNTDNPDVFAFVPLVDLAAGTKVLFTDNGWYQNGGFRNNEGVITFTAPAGGTPKGKLIIYSSTAADRNAGFSTNSLFLLSEDGEQILAYQGSSASPKFIYGLSLRKGWNNATSANTSALPPGLTDGVTAISLPWANAYQNQPGQRQGGVNNLRNWFTTSSNWTGDNTLSGGLVDWYKRNPFNTNLVITTLVAPVLATVPFAAGEGLSRVRTLTYNNASLSNPLTGEIPLTGLCSQPDGVRRVLLRVKLSANSLVDPGNGQPKVELHNLGDAQFSAKARLQLSTDAAPISTVSLDISDKTPEQTYLLDLTQHFTRFLLPGYATRLKADILGYGFSPTNLASNARLTVTLEEAYYRAPAPVTLPSTQASVPGRLEQELGWTPLCFTETYQLQLLKLTDEEVANAGKTQALLNSPLSWRQRATTLDFQTTDRSWKTTFGEGYGTYYYRVRALSNVTNVITNPENWGEWSSPALFRVEADGSGKVLNLANLNWIYSRTFTEGGRVSEKITYANGLLQPRQTLTRLASTQQVIGLQTVQDYVGRDALQSLPIPIVGGDRFLTYKPGLLRRLGTPAGSVIPYQAADFDQDAASNGGAPTVANPVPAGEQGYYDSSAPVYNTATPTSTTPALNAGVADAEGQPFARTLFTNDGTNRVREQGSAGVTLGLGQGHTVRTYYAAVAQDELDKLMGREAPLAGKTFKTLTFDPNNTTSVTYQTLDGKTIATALAGKGGPNLDALPATPAAADPRDKIRVTMTEKLDYNGIGTVGRQLLVMTEAGIKVDLKYKLTPGTLTDGCLPCSTCDYQVTIKCYRLEDGAQLTPVYTMAKELQASCPAADSLTGQFTTGAAGTYVVEKKVTAYNSAAGSSTTYLDDKLVALQQTYDAYPNQWPWRGANNTKGLLDFLTSTPTRPLDIAGFYDFLQKGVQNGSYRLRTAPDGLQYYQVPFGCSPGDSIAIPRLPLCGSGTVSACGSGSPTFESIFTTRWPASTGYTLAQAMPSFPYSAGAFDQLIAAMLQDSSPYGYAGKCADLQACWTAQVEAYEDMVTASNPAVGGPPVDLAQSFLACAQGLLTPPCTPQPCTPVPVPGVEKVIVSNTPTPSDFYKRAYYATTTPQNNVCRNCLSAIVGQSFATDADAISYLNSSHTANNVTIPVGLTPEMATNYANCLRNGQSGSQVTVTTTNNVTSQQAAVQVTAQLMGSCESRREEFRRAVVDQLAASNSTVTDCEVDKLTDELVLKCQADAQLTAGDFEPVPNAPANLNPAPMKPTAAAATRLQRIHVGRALVKVWPITGEGGDLPYQCSPITVSQSYYSDFSSLPNGAVTFASPIRPTEAAIRLIEHANELLRLKNRLQAQRQWQASQPNAPAATPLGCPATTEGFGELTLNQFTYIGRFGAQPENLNATAVYPGLGTQAGRQHYWAVIGLDNVAPASQATFSFLINLPSELPGPPATPGPAGLCLPAGEEPVGVPKLPTTSAYAPATRFWLEPVSGGTLTLASIASLSAPYCTTANVELTKQANPAEGVFVLVTLTDGTTVEARLHAPGTTASGPQPGYNVLNWRTPLCADIAPQNSPQQGRAYYACLEWGDQPPITVPAGVPVDTVMTCEMLQARQLLAAIQSQQQQLKADRLAGYRARYKQACALPENLNDKLVLGYQLGYHHYTLYYYDRAGQLMKTVPPAGVRPLDLSNPQHPVYPAHTLTTTYTYNSLGQLVRQHTPDGGDTRFYYNGAGQLRYSLNDKQLREQKYSFTVYDALGRVVQVGESTDKFSLSTSAGVDELAGPLADLDLVGVSPPTRSISNLTETTYTSRGKIAYLDGTPQRYLNNRVSFVTAYPHGYDDPAAEPTVTFYSYDPHGNVEWLCQRLPEAVGDKYVRYEYDLISNKVTKAAYQEGRVDQFFHQYQYDDDNRLLLAQTSADGLVWETDAEYAYYAHGPLQRTLLGDDRVQGLDYAYTLQGWLKALNHPDLSKAKDAGQDGVSSGAAADAFGMVLGYYRGDYRRQGSWLNGGVSAAPELAEPTASSSLFNGNIASWSSKSLGVPTQTVPTLTADHYRYDQLNRLVASEQRAPSSTGWQPTDRYGTSYAYDPNGNLTSLTRQAGQAGQQMDQLSYGYPLDGQGNITSNQLRHVKDAVGAGVSNEDVDAQPDDNYRYDAVGNLTQDTQGGVRQISWTPYGKIGKIEKTDGTVVTYRYDAQGQRIAKLFQSATGPSLSTYYVRDAMGNMLAVYEQEPGQVLRLVEQPLYGSARVGERKPGLSLPDPNAAGRPLVLADGVSVSRGLGQKYYELTDHLGNVRAVVTDQKTSTLDATTGQPVLTSLLPVLSNYYNYYAFGQLQPGRYGSGNSTAAGGYRFGYNGKEKDNNGELGLTTYDYGFRIYNPGIAKFLSVDPLASKYPFYTPYQFAGNNPIKYIDLDGLEPAEPGKKGEEQVASKKGTEDFYNWQWVGKGQNGSWVQGSSTSYSYGNVLDVNSGHNDDNNKKFFKEYSNDGLLFNMYGNNNLSVRQLDFQIGFLGGLSTGTDAQEAEGHQLYSKFVNGNPNYILQFSTSSAISGLVGADPEFVKVATTFENAAIGYFKTHKSLNGFKGAKILESSGFVEIKESTFMHAAMGGMQQWTAQIRSISDKQLQVRYTVWDKFGAGTDDAGSRLPGLSSMYWLQHNAMHYYPRTVGHYSPFIWNVQVDRTVGVR